MLKIIRERELQTLVDYTIEYRYKDDPEAGFSFPATSYGEPDIASMSQEMYTSYKACLTDPRLTEAEFTTSERKYVAPAIGQCKCGETIELYSYNVYGAVCCPKCSQWYNLFGQELLPPEQWEDIDDWGWY